MLWLLQSPTLLVISEKIIFKLTFFSLKVINKSSPTVHLAKYKVTYDTLLMAWWILNMSGAFHPIRTEYKNSLADKLKIIGTSDYCTDLWLSTKDISHHLWFLHSRLCSWLGYSGCTLRQMLAASSLLEKVTKLVNLILSDIISENRLKICAPTEKRVS